MDELPALPVDFKVPAEWTEIELRDLGGTVMLVGDIDTGKSTLARWMIEKACRHGRISAWLDADLGQSSLGIPCTLNLVIIAGESPLVVERLAFFVGNTSPRGHMLQVLTGLLRLSVFARSMGADPVFVDTSGLVAEESGGGALKEWESELLLPSSIIALQRGRELAHLLAPWRHDPRMRLYLLPVAPKVRRRPPETRCERRRFLFERFFAGAGTLCICKRQKAVYGLNNAQPGCLAGLNDREGFLLSAAVVTRIMPDGLELLSPWRRPDLVSAVRVGKLRIDPLTGAELRSYETI
jgi:polynucleotide 5'-hydroxyl-kinase GRC3/NOL9